MKLQTQIEQRLQDCPSVSFFQVENESHMHSVPANSETHFKITLVDSGFEGLRLVRRHQSVYALLAEIMQQGIHALALHTYTPEEWAQRQRRSPDSPQCLGGSKKA